MKDDDFKKLMESWMIRELDSAPQLRPTDEMYRRMLDKPKKSARFPSPQILGWTATGLAAALVIFLVIRHPELYRSGSSAPPESQVHTAPITEEAGADAVAGDEKPKKEGVAGRRGPKPALPPREPDEAPGRSAPPPAPPAAELESAGKLQQKSELKDASPKDLNRVEVFYASKEPRIRDKEERAAQAVSRLAAASPGGNFRISLQLAADSYVYIHLLDPAAGPIRLFPDPENQASRNPLPGGIPLLLPSESDWFVRKNAGSEATLTIAFSAFPLTEWSPFYDGFAADEAKLDSESSLESLKTRLAISNKLETGDIILQVLPLKKQE